MVALFLFLAITLIFGSYGRPNVAFAKSRGVTRGPVECENTPDNLVITCCQTETDSKGVEIKYCTICENTVPPSNCGPRFEDPTRAKLPTSDLPTVEQTPTVSQPKVLSGKNLSSLSTSTIEEQPSTTLQQQKTTTCPDGSTPDAKGNCPPNTTVQTLKQPSSDSNNLGNSKGGSETKSNSDNNNDNNDNPTSDHNKKGNDLGQKEAEGGTGSVTNKGDSDNN
jgi:hypothetical protein